MKRLSQIALCLVSAAILWSCETPLHIYIIEWEDGKTEEVVGTWYKSYVMNKSGVVVVKVLDESNRVTQSYYGEIKRVIVVK